MEYQNTTIKRKRKALLLLPLLVIPFLTLAFWALGGGKNEVLTNSGRRDGLNLDLPGAQLKDDKDQNKLSFYEAAERDSAKFREGVKNDPFLQNNPLDTSLFSRNEKKPISNFNSNGSALDMFKDPNEEKVYRKLAELNRQLTGVSTLTSKAKPDKSLGAIDDNYTIPSEDVDRLEGMMQNMTTGNKPDPEMDQINGMMERILDIQHPQRVKERLMEKTIKPENLVFQVDKIKGHAGLGFFDSNGKYNQTFNGHGFYSISDVQTTAEQNAMQAVVHQNQTLVNGAVIKLRLLDDVFIKGSKIPKENFVFGTVTLNNERLEIQIHSIRYNNSLYPVNLDVYDNDGMPGIYIPGVITRDVAKGSIDNATQMLEISSVDPSLKAQAASAGISTLKTWLSKKAKLVKVYVKAGYKVLLYDKNHLQ